VSAKHSSWGALRASVFKSSGGGALRLPWGSCDVPLSPPAPTPGGLLGRALGRFAEAGQAREQAREQARGQRSAGRRGGSRVAAAPREDAASHWARTVRHCGWLKVLVPPEASAAWAQACKGLHHGGGGFGSGSGSGGFGSGSGSGGFGSGSGGGGGGSGGGSSGSFVGGFDSSRSFSVDRSASISGSRPIGSAPTEAAAFLSSMRRPSRALPSLPSLGGRDQSSSPAAAAGGGIGGVLRTPSALTALARDAQAREKDFFFDGARPPGNSFDERQASVRAFGSH
jgi:hypothetical protein